MFIEVKVAIEVYAGNGKTKKKNENYLVNAMSVTEAEARVYEYFKSSILPFEVKSAKVSAIIDVIDTKESV